MPTLPPTHCKHPGCSARVPRGYCGAHTYKTDFRGQDHDAKRPNAHRRGYTRSWASIRLGHLKRSPLCLHPDCDGLTPADLPHHIVPLTEGGTHEEINLESVCTSHHAARHSRREAEEQAKRKAKIKPLLTKFRTDTHDVRQIDKALRSK